MRVFGGIELGGTNTTWGLAAEDLVPIASGTFATGDPAPTIDAAIAAILGAAGASELAALGIGAFGPLDLGPRRDPCARPRRRGAAPTFAPCVGARAAALRSRSTPT